jgi:hypothetical protein
VSLPRSTSRFAAREWPTSPRSAREPALGVFHLLDLAGGSVVAVEMEEADVLVSDDGGRSFEKRIGPNALVTDAAGKLYAAVPNGEVKVSDDGGKSWTLYAKLV